MEWTLGMVDEQTLKNLYACDAQRRRRYRTSLNGDGDQETQDDWLLKKVKSLGRKVKCKLGHAKPKQKERDSKDKDRQPERLECCSKCKATEEDSCSEPQRLMWVD